MTDNVEPILKLVPPLFAAGLLTITYEKLFTPKSEKKKFPEEKGRKVKSLWEVI